MLKNGFKISILFTFIFLGIFLFFTQISNSAKLTTSQLKIARDSKRINDIYLLQNSLEKYKNIKGYYPKIQIDYDNYFISGFISSINNGWDKFSSDLGFSNPPVDPINKISDIGNMWGTSTSSIKVKTSYLNFISTNENKCEEGTSNSGLYIDDIKKHSPEPGYTVYVFNKNWDYLEYNYFNTVTEDRDQNGRDKGELNAIEMKNFLINLSPDKYVVIVSYVDARENISVLWNTLVRFGAVPSTFDKIATHCGYTSSYILVGRKDIPASSALFEVFDERESCGGCPVSLEIDTKEARKNESINIGNSEYYVWTKGSNVYQYRYCSAGTSDLNCIEAGATEFEDSYILEFDLEDFSRIEDWGITDPRIKLTKDSSLDSKVYSNNEPICGNGIVEASEFCETGQLKTEVCFDSGNQGIKFYTCDNCSWVSGNEGICNTNPTFCGDGIIQEGEECDGGYQLLCRSTESNNWYEEKVRYCNTDCEWNISSETASEIQNNPDLYCGGYCGDSIIQESYGEECDDTDGNCTNCKYSNKPPVIEDMKITSYSNNGTIKEEAMINSSYMIFEILASNTNYAEYKWEILNSINNEVILTNLDNSSYSGEFLEGLNKIKLKPTNGSTFDFNYTGGYLIKVYLKNKYRDRYAVDMFSKTVFLERDFYIGRVCGDHIVQQPNDYDFSEKCEWIRGFSRNLTLETAYENERYADNFYRDQILLGGDGVDKYNQYYCDDDCNPDGGYCGDGEFQRAFERCDETSVNLEESGFMSSQVFGTGMDENSGYGCENCIPLDKYCGDGKVDYPYEVCDPKIRKIPENTNSSGDEYLCLGGKPEVDTTPFLETASADGLIYALNNNPNTSCRLQTGGYCGDSIVQYSYNFVDGFYEGVNSQNQEEYHSSGGAVVNFNPLDNFSLEECDPKNYIRPTPAESSSVHTYTCSDECTLTGEYCGDSITQIHFNEDCDKASYISPDANHSSSANTYECTSGCKFDGKYCGDGVLQSYKEDCDKATYINPSTSNSNINNTYVCNYDCEFSGGYCGDGTLQYAYKIVNGIKEDVYDINQYEFSINYGGYDYSLEKCDPLGYLSPSAKKSNKNYTYACATDCSLSGGYCGDKVLQPSKEECDKASYVNPAPSNSSASHEYICDSSCEFSGGYCGDGLVQYSYRTTGGINDGINSITQQVFSTSHRNYEYLIEQCDPVNYIPPVSASASSPKYTYTCSSGCLSNGGYCGDGKLQPSMEACDYRNFVSSRPTPAESRITRQYDCNANCFYTGGWCGDGIVQSQYGESCDDENCYESCSVCGYGYYLNGGICKPCPIDTYRETPGATSLSQCLASSIGYYAPSASRNDSSCTNRAPNSSYVGVGGGIDNCPYLCDLDYYSVDSGLTCTSVGIGYYSLNKDNSRKICTNSTSSANFSYTSDGNGENNCEWSCNLDYYLVNGSCVPVGIGYYSPNNNNTRTACTNKPTNSTYTTDGNGTNSCEWLCDLDYYLSGSACVAVGTGYFSPALNNSRTDCTNKPANSTYTSDGNGTNSCEWLCDLDYYLSGSACVAVGTGYFSPALNNSRTDCTNKPANSTYASDGNGTNSCEWLCDLDYYLSGSACVAVGTGYFSPALNNSRTDCTNKPSNSAYTTDGNGTNSCEWLCDLDYYLSGSACVAVGTGYYSPALNNARTDCTNKPANSAYTTDGNGTNSCEWTCNSGYYQSGNSCVACPIDTYRATSGATTLSQCLACSIEQYSIIGSSSCSSCTNKPANSTYTSDGNGTNSCGWTCNSGYYQSGNSCLAPSSGYCSSLNGSTCSGTGTLGSTRQAPCSTEMYDTRTNFSLGNPNCGTCSYGSWYVSTCNSTNHWNASRLVTNSEMSGYCGDLNTSTYGSCTYCSNPGSTCWNRTTYVNGGDCCAVGVNYSSCPSGWTYVSNSTFTRHNNCGWPFKWNCDEGRTHCKQEIICGGDYTCSCGSLSSCPCYGEGCAN